MATLVRGVTECSLCMEVFTSPKVLPCFHTFCLPCLRTCDRNKKPGDTFPCPLCRTHFRVPSGGLSDLPDNQFAERLKMFSLTPARPVDLCEVCTVRPPRSADQICVECQQKMCVECAGSHKRMQVSKSHRVVLLELQHVFKNTSNLCRDHPEERTSLFCVECSEVICVVCSAVKHHAHQKSSVDKAYVDVLHQLQIDTSKVTEHSAGFREDIEKVASIKIHFREDVAKAKDAIDQKCDELKRIIDLHKRDLFEELDSQECAKLKELTALEDRLDLGVGEMESFQRFAVSVSGRGIPVKVCRLAKELHDRADELCSLEVIGNLEETNVCFTSTDVANKMLLCHNGIGKLNFKSATDSPKFFRVVKGFFRQKVARSSQSSPVAQQVDQRPVPQPLEPKLYPVICEFSAPNQKSPRPHSPVCQVQSHDGRKLDNIQVCPYCDHVFPVNASKNKIADHVKTHTNRECPVCNLAFTLEYNDVEFERHVNNHF